MNVLSDWSSSMNLLKFIILISCVVLYIVLSSPELKLWDYPYCPFLLSRVVVIVSVRHRVRILWIIIRILDSFLVFNNNSIQCSKCLYTIVCSISFSFEIRTIVFCDNRTLLWSRFAGSWIGLPLWWEVDAAFDILVICDSAVKMTFGNIPTKYSITTSLLTPYLRLKNDFYYVHNDRKEKNRLLQLFPRFFISVPLSGSRTAVIVHT